MDCCLMIKHPKYKILGSTKGITFTAKYCSFFGLPFMSSYLVNKRIIQKLHIAKNVMMVVLVVLLVVEVVLVVVLVMVVLAW